METVQKGSHLKKYYSGHIFILKYFKIDGDMDVKIVRYCGRYSEEFHSTEVPSENM